MAKHGTGVPWGEWAIWKPLFIGGLFAIAIAVAIAVVFVIDVRGPRDRPVEPGDDRATRSTTTGEASTGEPASEADQGFLYGRVVTVGGTTYEGRLRWGGAEEAFWGDYFNGRKNENPWAAHVPRERLEEQRPIEVFGVEIARREVEIDLERPFMARFGDIARIDPRGRDLQVTLKSGTVFHLDRFAADDLADGLRVWDRNRGTVDVHERNIWTVEFLPTAHLAAAPKRLHGTVRTRQGEFTGFLQWNREEGVGTDELNGETVDGPLGVRFDAIRSVERTAEGDALVILLDAREIVLSGTREAGRGHRGIYVDDPRFGRVLVSWNAFERVDFSPGGSGPAYDDFPPGTPFAGTVTARDGRRLAGRLVYDLDESETTETLDAPFEGVDYTIPIGLIGSIVPASGTASGEEYATVVLHGGAELRLEPRGDLGEGNAGMLVFAEGRERPDYLSWADVERVEFDRPAAMYPPLDGRRAP